MINQIEIVDEILPEGKNISGNVYKLTYEQANQILPILRSDHFKQIILAEQTNISNKQITFLMQISRLLTSDGSLKLYNQNPNLQKIIKVLGLYQLESEGRGKVYTKSKPEKIQSLLEHKLPIGFKEQIVEDQIDEDELLNNENIKIKKQKVENCDTKPRACANCSCGRKNNEKPLSKVELVQSINEGQPVSGCGKCSLGDSFRCGSCPYKGLPAFKLGDKLKMVEEGAVLVEEASTVVSRGGKVKIQL